MLGQICVFDGADTHCASNFTQLGFFQGGVFFLDQGVGALFCLIKQVDQLDRAAVARLERAAICTIHGPEPHMFKTHGWGNETSQTSNFKGHLEVQCLALVDKVKDSIGIQNLATVAHGCQIGRGVQVAASCLLHDHRKWIAFRILELFKENAAGAIAFGKQALGIEFGHDTR